MLPTTTTLARYLDAMSKRMRQAQNERKWGCCPFATISRQAGANGHLLAETVLAEIARRSSRHPELFADWHLFDEAMLRLLTEHPGLKVSLEDVFSEEYRTRIQDTMHQILTGSPPQDLVLARVFHSLRAVAGMGKAVIVGRSGACLTRDLHLGVHVRLVASQETRVEILGRQLGLEPREALRRLRRIDAARAALVRDHFGRDIDDPLLYDAVWNIDRMPLAEIARWICDALEKKAAEAEGMPYSASQRAASSA